MNRDGLRVTVVSRIYLPETAAASFRLGALVQRLISRGAMAEVLTASIRHDREAGGPAPGRVRRWPVLRDRSGYVRGYAQYLSFDIPVFFRLLFSAHVDVVVVEPPPTTGFAVRVACALKRTPYVYYAADIWSDAAASTGSPAIVVRSLRMIESWVMAGAGCVLAVNEDLAARVTGLAPTARVEVVGNGVDIGTFTWNGPIRERGTFAIYAGTTSEWQGADIFVHAFQRARERAVSARIVFLGQGSAWESLKALTAELGLQDSVEFINSVPASMAAEWLRGARFAMVSMKPDQGYDYALPTKVLAALATGTPVLYVGRGPAEQLLDSAPKGIDPGVVVPYKVDEVADHLVDYFEGPVRSVAARKALSEWAAGAVSLDAVADRVVDVLHNLIRHL